jgi:hypothetical protein
VFDVYLAGALEGINAKKISVNAIIVANKWTHMEGIFTAKIAERPTLNFTRNNHLHQPVLTAVRIYHYDIREKDWSGAIIAARGAPLITNHNIPRPILHLPVPGHH